MTGTSGGGTGSGTGSGTDAATEGGALDPRLREIIVCPACHGDLDDGPDGPELVCRACGNAYPVRDGIPVLLVDEARPGAGGG